MYFFTDPPLHDFSDRAHRRLLEYPNNLRDLVRVAAPDLAGGFVFSRTRKLDHTLPLPDWRRRESDLLFTILMWLLLSWSVRRRPKDERADLVALAAASHEDAILRREVEQMSQALGQMWEEEVQERVERGRREAALLAHRADLRALLESRFGSLPEAVTRRIELSEDADRLKAALTRVLQIKTADELQL